MISEKESILSDDLSKDYLIFLKHVFLKLLNFSSEIKY